MTLTGKGFFIWQIQRILNAEGGDSNTIANLAQEAGLTHVVIKIADGASSFNLNRTTGEDYAPALVAAMKARGIQVWGWHYVYGYDPIGEARIASQRVQSLGLDGYAIDAEAEYKQSGKDAAAVTFMNRLRANLGTSVPIALCSYRYPSYHPNIPWREFLEQCDLNMPQMYWLQAHNPGEQLIRCVREFQGITPFRPIVPVGAAFTEGGWTPTDSEIVEFMQTAQSLNLSAVNYWEWYNTRIYLSSSIWQTIKNYSWGSAPPPPTDIVQQYFAALKTRDPNQVATLYSHSGVHVTALQTVQGPARIADWYRSFFNSTLPNSTFTLTSVSGDGNSRHFTWTATSAKGSVSNGSDTLGLVNGKIGYHFTTFTVR